MDRKELDDCDILRFLVIDEDVIAKTGLISNDEYQNFYFNQI